MFGSKEEPCPRRVLINFWCYYDNKKIIFLLFRILADFSVLLILAIIKI